MGHFWFGQRTVSPSGAAVDGSGNVYVADTDNHRIQKFNSAGTFITKWGNNGSGGQFYYPSGVGFDGSGNLYVADQSNNRIQKFSSTGTFITKWGSYGTGDGQFSSPSGVTVDGSGNVYVADTYNKRIQKFSSTGDFIAKWGTSGSGDGQFDFPRGVAVDGSGNVYVADTHNHRIQKFSSAGIFIAKWGNYGSGDGQFYYPSGVAVDGSGNVYVADTHNNRMQKFSNAGTFIIKWGRSGSGDGLLNSPYGVAVDGNGNVYVADTNNNRIQKFSNTTGDLFTIWGSYGASDGQFSSPYGVTVDASGNVYVADTYNHRIQKFAMLEVTSFSPLKATVGSTVTITGKNFSAVASENSVSFNGVNATIASTTASSLTVTVPSGATTGKISVSRSGYTALSPNEFLSLPFAITSFSPGIGDVGTSVTITGTGFSSVAGNNVVKFNGVMATVTQNTATQLKATVPSGGLNGKITITTAGETSTSASSFDLLTLTGFSPARGTSGSAVTLTGTGLTSEATVKFNGVTGVVTNATGTSLTTTVPANVTTGKITVTRESTTLTSTNEFLSLPLAITSFSPGIGNVGTIVTIIGTGFSSVAANNSVKFNGVSATVTGSSPTTMTATVPAGGIGGAIAVTTAGQTTTSAENFYSLTLNNFTPVTGTSGTTITLAGTGFNASSVVKFNDAAGVVTSSTPTSMTVTVPANVTTGKVTVTREGITVASQNEFLSLPFQIKSFHPSVAMLGNVVTITGSGFSSVNANNLVKFNEETAVVIESSPTQIKTIVPSNATSGKISITVEGQTASSAIDFKITRLAVTDKIFPAYYTFGSASADVTITVNDINELQAVRFISKGITASENTLKTDNIVLASSKTLAFSIPSSYFNDPIGLAGYFILTDKEGNEIVSEKGYTYINYPGSVSTHTIPNLVFGKSVKNYQIFSIPLKLKNNLVSDVFDELGDYDNTKWRLYSHDGTSNSEMNSSSKIDAGIGYWLIIKDETIINPGEGNTVAVTEEEPFIITLSSGQNLIGNPYNFDVSWSDVLAFNNNLKAVGNLIQYNDGVIAESDLLKRYCGAFVRNTSNTSIAIKIPVKSNSTGGRKSSVAFAHNSIDSDSWMVRLILEDASLKNELGGFGMHPEAEYNEDQWDETTFPFPGVSGFKLVMKELPEKILVRDVVKSADEHTWAGQITSEHGVTLRWDNSYFGNNDKQLVMEINNRIELIDMRTTAELRLPAGKQNFSIHYGDAAYIKESTLTEKTGVGMVYPNPMKRSSEVLSIPSALPQGISEINLSLIDMMGKTATRSSEANYNEGRQTIEWKNDFTIVSSGVYLVKISIKTASGSSNFYRKVMIE